MMQPAPLPSSGPHQTWTTESLEPGQSVYGYMCGQPFGAWTHYNVTRKASKPCRWAMTRERMPCLLCGTTPPRWIAYTPFYVGPKCDRYYYILSKTVAKNITHEHLMKPWKLHRPEGKGQKYQLKEASKSNVGFPLGTEHEILSNDTISRYLFHLWGDAALAEFFGYILPKPTLPPEDERAEKRSAEENSKAPKKRVVTPQDLFAHAAGLMDSNT